MARANLIWFYKEFRDSNLQFSVTDWAQCLVYMAQNIDSMEKPKEPTLAEVEEH